MHVAFIYNVRHTKPALDKEAQDEAEFDEPETISAIHDAIVASGYECIDIEADEDAYGKLQKLKGKIDLVFNIAEGLRGELREAQIPAMLEMLGIPYTHSGALADAITLDKSLTKKVWQFHGLPTPRFVEIGIKEKPYVEGLRFPVIVKPNSEGSSKGVFNDNLVEDPNRLVKKIRDTRKAFGNGVIVEEFMSGREFTVAVLGNPSVASGQAHLSQPYILPIVEQNYDIFPDTMKKFASYEAKWFFEDTLPNPHIAYHCPAKLTPTLEKLIEELCINAYTVLNCRDIARIDLRCDSEGKPHLLEINTLPGMMPNLNVVSYYPIAARAAGWDFNRMIGQIITHARERLGI
ncbi:D-alanine--D-alanine ligase [Candidatus Gottesmanbacteria bacterium]|nr:D-alanine--D-alanine ligase [Candidatus Gottesmanbacteria bacterium]